MTGCWGVRACSQTQVLRAQIARPFCRDLNHDAMHLSLALSPFFFALLAGELLLLRSSSSSFPLALQSGFRKGDYLGKYWLRKGRCHPLPPSRHLGI